ncbi:peroxisomal membrane protein 2 isoform X1 [Dipodomys spectabilis]|uniref:peroxisomal membrane protein 2 isoform X1 n=1 Tax=Dipodomys spectabilis TaxID=105255 RepID=UPI001C53C1C5|nr:peroxisomal membrane protein 2 isoform X1 [Dipodomys spectabilis]
MAPAASRLRAEAALGALPRRALARYLLLLRRYPVLTKAASSGILSALGNLLAQMIEKKQRKKNSQNLDVCGPLRYAVYGFFVTGPLSHYFYLFMEHWIPPEVPLATVKRLLLDRLLFAPAFLMLFFLFMNLLEGKDTRALAARTPLFGYTVPECVLPTQKGPGLNRMEKVLPLGLPMPSGLQLMTGDFSNDTSDRRPSHQE